MAYHSWTRRGARVFVSSSFSPWVSLSYFRPFSASSSACDATRAPRPRAGAVKQGNSIESGGVFRRGRSSCSHTARSLSTRAAPGLDSNMSPEHWKALYRAFLLHVHPDFFHDLPTERAVNEKNLQALSMYLEQRDHTTVPDRRGGHMITEGSARLVFFLKTEASTTGGTEGSAADAPRLRDDGSGSDAAKLPPRKVMLPLQSHRNSTKLELQHLLHTAGVVLPAEIPDASLPPLRTRQHQAHRESTTATTPFGWDDDGGDGWMEDLFGGTAAHRAWDKAHSTSGDFNHSGRHHPGSPLYNTNINNGSGHDQRRRADERNRRAAAPRDELAHVLSTEAGRTLVRERRGSARKVQRLVKALKEQYGFGEFTFRCGWSKANLCMALSSLLDACATHRAAFRVPRFGGLNVVFRNDPSVLDKGEIRLCPADVPLVWVSVLQGVTLGLIATEEERSRELVRLEQEASNILRGAAFARGLSCSKSRYHEFLRSLCSAERLVGGDGAISAKGDWSGLLCRVEEGFGRASKILDDGALQIGTDMTLATIWKCLERNFPTACAISEKSQHLAATASRSANRLRNALGLETVDCATGVSFAQMTAACEGLTDFCEGEGGAESGYRSPVGGRGEEDAASVRRRLRGHCVMIVGERHGAVDGVTEDGEIAIRWDYWDEAEGREGKESQTSSTPFS